MDKRVWPTFPKPTCLYIMGYKQSAHENTENTYSSPSKKDGMFWHVGGGQENWARVLSGLQTRLLQFRPAAICFPTTKPAAVLVAE